MSTLLLAVVGASLLGSLHCAGMCGAFAAIAMSSRRAGSCSDAGGCGPDLDGTSGRPARAAALQSAYHGGRLLGYVALGLAAGAAGALLDLGGVLAGLSSAAAVLAGATLVIFGGVELARQLGLRFGVWKRLPRPAFLNGLVRRATRTDRPVTRALAMGVCSGLLPCGWLYAFVVTAAGTGGPFTGALVMGAFWIGTVPILAAVGFSSDHLRRAFGSRVQLVASAAILLLGVATLVGRVELDATALARRVEDTAAAQGPSETSSLPDPAATPACCAPDGD
ncbi:hypothetical protein Pla163_12200 [Planctomycetes bacterium Pla163]|uniref:Urease accessory protein UreH-like transmembrane domain-containing protein n=1 Tax=Rohdeia mirabilis TaxID=2528008 RepID=A0A518CY44_9BACT|nr:hypothetical protein Pla163_12200 [Planctomycetes bacterium Pla163]